MIGGIRLTEKEAVGVYLLLRARETRLDYTLAKLRKRIERALYSALTVEEIDDLEGFYRSLADREGTPGS